MIGKLTGQGAAAAVLVLSKKALPISPITIEFTLQHNKHARHINFLFLALFV